MTEPRLLTIILNYQTAEMTLQSLAATVAEMKGISGEILVVDNFSGDGSFEAIGADIASRGWGKDGRVRVMQAGRNGGFGAGNNFGIRAGLSDGQNPDFVYILNSDAFPDRDAIRLLLARMVAEPELGMAGSYIHGPDGTPHQTAFRFPSIASEFEGAARFGPISRLLRNSIVPLPLPQQACRVDWLAGASVMMRQKMLDQIGLFDENYFLYFEETDLCLRAQKAGWPTLYLRESAVTHISGASTGIKKWTRVPQYWFDSRHYYFSKNHGARYAAFATVAHLAGGLLWRLRMVIERKPRVDPPHFLADLMRHALSRARRRNVQPPDNYILENTAKTPDRRQA